MRVVIEVVRGPQLGQRRLLTSGNQLIVGRSEFADLSCPTDSQMSREHFRVTANDTACILEDLSSRNGTTVNEIPVDKPVQLNDGDRITTGATAFMVMLQGGRSADFAATQTGVRPEALDPRRSAVIMDALRGRLKGTYGWQQCHSGLYQCSGDCQKIPPGDIAELLSRQHEAYLVVDRNKSGIELPSMDASPAILFDFLPVESAETVSPVIISGADCPEWPTIISDSWGSDSLIVIYSDESKDEVIRTFRLAVQSERGGIVGLCWPGVLDAMLTVDQSGTASKLVNLAKAILIETPDLPEQWRIYSRDDLRSVLNRYGLRQDPSVVPGEPVSSASQE